jgi:SAM-dependent methyltransferase
MPDHSGRNRAYWDERAIAHAASNGYGFERFERFERDPSYLSGAVRFDLPRLGDVAGLRGVHLQCHIGTDTVSLARLGAQMTGLDFSPASLTEARRLAALAGAAVEFVEADVVAAPDVLGEAGFDLVYTGMGALCWLPSIRRWAAAVSRLLRPGGRLFLREAHPVLWALADDAADERLVLEHPYFELEDPVVWDSPETYVDTDATFALTASAEWNHGIGEILSALLADGLQITRFDEHDSVPWDALAGKMEELAGGEWRLRERPWRLPHSYTLEARKLETAP